MWKLCFLFVLLSVDAQRLKLNQIVREGVEISDVTAYEDTFSYRLPNVTRPESYVINLDFGDFQDGDMSFTGIVGITIRVVEKTDTITLHNSVTITGISLRTSNDVEVPFFIVPDEFDRDFLIIKTTSELETGASVQLTLSYHGAIGTSISGIYRGSYQHDGETRWQ